LAGSVPIGWQGGETAGCPAFVVAAGGGCLYV